MSIEAVVVIVVITFLVYRVLGRKSDIHVAVTRSKILEGLLKRELHATGTGLGEKVESVKHMLPDETYQQFQEIIPERNNIVHDDTYNKLDDRQGFIRLCDSIESTLDELKTPEQAQNKGTGCLVVFFVIAIISYFLVQNPL